MRGTAVGIDIGTTAVTTVVARGEKDGSIRILGVGTQPSAGVRRGAITDVEEAAGALKRSIAEAERSSGVRIRSAVVGVGGAHIGSSVVRGAIAVSRADGEITEEDVARVIEAAERMAPKNPNREIIHVIPREFKVDGQGGLSDPVGMVGMKLEVEALVIDGAKPALQNLIRSCELAGVAIEDWASSILASAEFILTKKQKELGAMLLDLGAGTTDFAVFEEGRVIDAGSFPIGGNHITSDIAIGFRAPPGAAEEIKLRYSHISSANHSGKRETIRIADFVPNDDSVFAVRDLTDIIAARLTDIFELSVKALKKIGRAGLLPGGVVLTGGGADIPGIQDLARRELELPAEVAKAIAAESFADVVPPRLAVPVGLILWQERERGASGRGWLNWGGGFGEGLKRLFRSFVP